MSTAPIDVTAKGAVLLGDKVVCDGFVHGYPYRVQTHVHADHMEDFDSSKGFQRIYMTEPTRQLLIAELNAELKHRDNVRGIPVASIVELDDLQIELVPNGHMLGCVQTAVTLTCGTRLGYSGDFQWPIDRVIEVDALVIDSTYGSPSSIRRYTQQEAESRFVDLVREKIRFRPIIIKAHKGTLQRALELLDDRVSVPLIGTDRLCKEAEVYRSFGYSIPTLLSITSDEGKSALVESRYIRVYGTGDGLPADPSTATTITLSAYMTDPRQPVLEFSDRAYRVALSGHADFMGTLEYVRATGAQYVVTDNSRGGHAVELAIALRSHLGLEVRPSGQAISRSWGT